MTLPSRTRSPSESFAEVSRRLTNSTEGRFTIIDETSKDSESFDDASSTDSDEFGNKFSRSKFFGQCLQVFASRVNIFDVRFLSFEKTWVSFSSLSAISNSFIHAYLFVFSQKTMKNWKTSSLKNASRLPPKNGEHFRIPFVFRPPFHVKNYILKFWNGLSKTLFIYVRIFELSFLFVFLLLALPEWKLHLI